MSNKLDFSKELIGHRALVTGGSRGIGAAIAQRLLDAGAKVVVAARTRSDDTPAAATFVSGDVTTSEGVEGIATKALAALGGLDILVNNAGGGGAFLGGSWTIPDKEWHDNFAQPLRRDPSYERRPPGAPSVEGRSHREHLFGGRDDAIWPLCALRRRKGGA